MTNSYTSCLSINKMRLSVRLGYEKEERALAQSVDVDIKLYYPGLTEACRSDDGDYSCYDKLSRKIQQLCESKEFRLIEYLCTEIYNTARGELAQDIKIRVTVTKCGLPVGFVLGGASFSHTDLPPFSWVVPE
ncbi:MAG TPA: dihydroneopterin aldolase [Rickettsiales bacterium]|nr:dihydroneopterin aldolase [Rickettsiales bacterium]